MAAPIGRHPPEPHLRRTAKRHPGLEITTSRLSGRPVASLPAEASKAEMLVIGSLRLTGVPGSLIGSIAMATISATERPVVLVRAAPSKGKGETGPRTGDEPVEGTGPYRDVVVGVDIDQSCDGLLAFAFDEAAQRACTLQVVHAWSLPLGFSYAPAIDPRDPIGPATAGGPDTQRPAASLAREVPVGERRREGRRRTCRSANAVCGRLRGPGGRRPQYSAQSRRCEHRPRSPCGDAPRRRTRAVVAHH
ncbi:universal stress protein [Streptomyces sp. NBC_00191]